MISVVIPTLNEQDHIGALLNQLSGQQQVELEVIVADGRSTDNTLAIARAGGATVVESAPGRGRQLNAGARAARGEYLLFLHADSRLSHRAQLSDATRCMRAHGGVLAGHFPLRFDTADPAIANTLAFFEAKSALNRPGAFNGDQGLFISATHFNLLGGFSERHPFLEDRDFADRFRKTGEFITLPGRLISSARRFEAEGARERITLNAIIMGMYHLGLDGFFQAAPGAYKARGKGRDRLDLRPFFALAQSCLFGDGLPRGVGRCYRIGRYATGNFWQVFLLWGIKYGSPAAALDRYDRFVRPVTANPPVYLLASLVVVAWFFTAKLRRAASWGRGRDTGRGPK